MTVTELTKEIYDKYPKVWEKLNEWFNNYKYDNPDYSLVSKISHEYIVFYLGIYDMKIGEIPFNMLYGLLEDFFEENGIILYYERDLLHFGWYVYIDVPKNRNLDYSDSTLYISKNEAKQQSILKACEIL